jgi:hypothetical protein
VGWEVEVKWQCMIDQNQSLIHDGEEEEEVHAQYMST